MPVERSAGIIFFRNTSEGRRYLIVRSARDIPGRPAPNSRGRVRIGEGRRPEARYSRAEFWDIPKGQLAAGEKGIDAAIREAGEETGIDRFSIIPEFKHTVRYFTRREGKPVPKFVAVFLAEAGNGDIKLSWEHDAYEWAAFDDAMEKLTTMKSALQAAEEFISSRS